MEEFDAYLAEVNRSRVSVIGRIAQVCPRLEVLDVERSCLNVHDVRAIADNCPNFRALTAWSADLHEGIFLDLSRCAALRELFLGYEVQFGPMHHGEDDAVYPDGGVPAEFDAADAFDRFTRGCPLLAHVSMHLEGGYVFDGHLRSLGRHCPHLVAFEAPECDGISDEGVEALVKGCPQLENLNLGSNSYPTSMHSGCPITDSIVYVIACGLPALTNLNLRGCGDVTEEAIAALRAALPDLVIELPWAEILDDP